ncbi:hypothetical protein K7X08_023821 [Anisodus acutangulus]|uniref:Intermembrane lipid transfer protein VPS13-like C-terminal domain-containing protein n=1 Tax=Anisodus acutangulus TaxID=402998 RepID=A0A9Q1LAN4_9SOLA|nr:hypothetical protein K7X08_023821 [Anisodus acutangulus]
MVERNCRRKYVNLYKIKLKCLRQDQVIDVDVLQMLELIEKKSEVDDILNYRSTAERELLDILLYSSSSNVTNIVNTVKPLEDEHLSSKPRGWLNWLSRGMLGAGGTDDSSQFSGVISDDVVKGSLKLLIRHLNWNFSSASCATEDGLTGLLKSPIKGAERHGLPGVCSGIALGVTGFVSRSAASILDITGKTAQSIRNRSKRHNRGSHRFRVRLPRHLSRELPTRPYCWEEEIGVSVVGEAEDHVKLKDEILVMCNALRHYGKFVILTERLILIVSCSSIAKYRMPEFQGVPANPEWLLEIKIRMDSVIHADNDDDEVHIVGSSSDALLKQNQISHKRSCETRGKRWNNYLLTSLLLLQNNLVFIAKDEAEDFLQVLLSTINKAKEQDQSSVHLLHESSLRLLMLDGCCENICKCSGQHL